MTDTTKKAGHDNIGVNELFQIAMKVERNAVSFYKKAADLSDNVRVSELFRRLQSWECEHLSAIDEMHSKLTPQSSDPAKHLPGKRETSEAVLMAGLAVFGIHPDPSDELSGSENCIEAMDLAVRKEEDTIVFFDGLKGFMKDSSEHHNVDLIISEEIEQIRHLEQARQQLMDAKTTRAFGDAAAHIAVSSTKSMIGHTLGAAGAIEAAATVLALHHGVIPPTINYDTPDPQCDLDYVPNEARKGDIKAVLSNSFGFGGTNASLIFKKL